METCKLGYKKVENQDIASLTLGDAVCMAP